MSNFLLYPVAFVVMLAVGTSAFANLGIIGLE